VGWQVGQAQSFSKNGKALLKRGALKGGGAASELSEKKKMRQK